MTKEHPFLKIKRRWRETDSMAGVGLDPDIAKIPDEVWDEVGGRDNVADGFYFFLKAVIDATAGLAVDYKVNSSFFFDEQGRQALAKVFMYIKNHYPKVLRVCDGKFADVGNTTDKLVEAIFDGLDADAVLLNPYLGFDGIEAFADREDKIVILCVNTSNPSAAEIQNLNVGGEPLWMHILKKSMHEWNRNGNIIPVLSATHPEQLQHIRDIVGETPILLAGVGAQGGSLKDSVPHLLDQDSYGLMISSSRGILYPARLDGETIGDASLRQLKILSEKINKAKNGS